ncbi:DUF4876 domain-containing protein [Candidatus Palauibacter sp.]|uniref:DUF4876 domain-containing protein n=1 Tax=Candidatus Palauibacter sp. TaxID=3101350 RepID=UPI003B528BC9
MIAPRRRRRTLLGQFAATPAILMLSLLATGCAGEVGFSDAPPGGGDHLRPGLTLHVRLAPEAADIAQELGWTAGVPGAEVRVHRIGTDFAWETAVTDDQGTAHMPQLVGGRYRVAVYRPLSDAEAEQAGIEALAAGRIMNIAAAGTEQMIDLVPNRTGSLVISEIYAPATFVAELSYNFHMYFEVYNNSDRTVFLDGLTFGKAQFIDVEAPHTSCAATAQFRKDPDGVWGEFLHRFPGSGGEYPLAPGDAAVIALDAIDHSVVDPRFPDLSNADFELFGSGDVDNPDVPNLPEIGLQPWFHGHGLLFYVGHSLFIANELNVSTLERAVITTPAGDLEHLRIPVTDLIDVVWTEEDDALNDRRYVRCDGVVHQDFDQLGGGFLRHGVELTSSVQRVRLPGAAGDLQDTNVSAVDFVKGPITPGTTR